MSLTISQVAESCSARNYGVPVSFLGEEQDGVAAFTDSPRRALAAINRLVRTEIGDPFAELYDPTSLTKSWVLAYDNCGCNHVDPQSCRGDLNGSVTCCKVDPEDESAEEIIEHDCPHYGLPPCIEDLYSWVTERVAEGTPGALPMFQVSQ